MSASVSDIGGGVMDFLVRALPSADFLVTGREIIE